MARFATATLSAVIVLLLAFAYRLAFVLSRDPREDALLEALADAALRADELPNDRVEETRWSRFD